MNKHSGHLYFVGITGHAMRGLALAATKLGYTVTGWDGPAAGLGADWVTSAGLAWTRDFQPEYLDGVTAVIVTGAHVSDTSPVVLEARRRDIAIKSFAQLVGELTLKEHVIAVAGTHGKTSTTALITWLLESAGRQPDFLIGIRPFNFDSSVRIAHAQVAVIEGDEYRASPLETKSKLQYFHPNALILTNVEMDHPDFFADLDAVTSRFREIIAYLPPDGRLIVCADSATAMDIAASAPCAVITYGLADADYVARNIAYLPAGVEFDIEAYGNILGRVGLPMYGRHSVLNALAAICAALKEGLSLADIIAASATFKGAYRRFNIVSSPSDSVAVIDDYAHHPTEVAATIAAASLHFKNHRIVAIFRPHTYSRTIALLHEYKTAFTDADVAYITDIEGAREEGSEQTISGADVARQVGAKAAYYQDRSRLVQHVVGAAKPGDIVLCMSVSGYNDLSGELASKFADA